MKSSIWEQLFRVIFTKSKVCALNECSKDAAPYQNDTNKLTVLWPGCIRLMQILNNTDFWQNIPNPRAKHGPGDGMPLAPTEGTG